MKFDSIKKYLKPYSIVARRRTTINHAFAAALASHQPFDAAQVQEAMRRLGMDPFSLICAYCGIPASTWDHVNSTVKNSSFSGHGHHLGNLVPCCNHCNSSKGRKDWLQHLESLNIPDCDKTRRERLIRGHIQTYGVPSENSVQSDDHRRLEEIKSKILNLMQEADQVAARIRMSSAHADLAAEPGRPKTRRTRGRNR